jgi:hypothetical protein
MRTVEQAREAAIAQLAASGLSDRDAALIESKTEQFDAGWVFYYQSPAYLQMRDPREMLVGNAPIFVPRNGAHPQYISYHRPTEQSVEAFVSCGNANGQLTSEVELTGWRDGAIKVSATQAIREFSLLGLGAAKEAIDLCLSKSSVRVQTRSVSAARELVSKLESLGFAANVVYGG